MEMKKLQDLFLDLLKDTYDAEHQITQALPRMAKAAKAPELKAAFESHLSQTENQIKRLEQVFEKMDKKAVRKPCKGMKGLIDEGAELIKEAPDADVLDAGLIAAAQKVEHYEISTYGTARAYALQLGLKDVARLLEQSLKEESDTDEKLSTLAESKINIQAA